MDPRRRSVMQSLEPTAGRSGIPLPSIANKPIPNLRASLARPAQTPYTSHYMSRPNNRQSIFSSQNPLLQSASKPPGRTPMNNSARRTSVWPPGAIGGAPSNSQTTKDTRPLRDKAYQAKMRHDILDFFQNAGHETITMNTLINIQGKDFRAIFDYLILSLDASYPLNPKASIQEQFIPALKYLKYPYVSQIDNKWLAAPASMHSWPSLLGILHWLVQLCQMRNHYLASGHPTLQISSDIPDEFDDPMDHTALAYDFAEQAYSLWLDSSEEDSRDLMVEPKQILEERYAKKNERVQLDLEQLRKQLDDATIEYDKLKTSAAPIAKAQDENGLLKGDNEKFQKIIQVYEVKKKKLISFIAQEKTELARKDESLAQMKMEQERLSDIVKTQNLSPEEVSRMTTEHETLSRNLEDLRQKIAETHRAVLNLEVNVTNRAAATEEALDAYVNLLSSLELLRLYHRLSKVQLLKGAEIRKVIRPTLNSVAESKRSERASVESERIKVDNELDQLMAECENLDLETIEVEKKVVSLHEQAEDLRDAAQQEALVASNEATRVERELAHARTAALANGMGVNTRLTGLQFKYQEQVEKVSRLKEATVRAIIKNSNDIAMFKSEVSRHLADLREFVDTSQS
ncbi:HEC/Ndc80p family-domain-containing protein [Armillaria luteobubalina]|uniref:Kinetochore protein NDC80 n=1 Tax=Armillaria luteobubalina TaxID=153913 RepID=A0AA39QIK8_9AGAR|nr:HEC/Ndc80p family-domain-containing protein [Armillaria luteobubalina]